MQITCTLLQTDNHASQHLITFLQARCSSWCSSVSVKALKAIVKVPENKFIVVLEKSLKSSWIPRLATPDNSNLQCFFFRWTGCIKHGTRRRGKQHSNFKSYFDTTATHEAHDDSHFCTVVRSDISGRMGRSFADEYHHPGRKRRELWWSLWVAVVLHFEESLISMEHVCHFCLCEIKSNSYFLPSSGHHLSSDDCLEDRRENYQNCFLLCCVWQLYTVIRAYTWAVLTVERWFLLRTAMLALQALY